MPVLLYEAIDKRPLFGVKRRLIDETPVALVQGERLFFVNQIILSTIPGDQVELRVIGQSYWHDEPLTEFHPLYATLIELTDKKGLTNFAPQSLHRHRLSPFRPAAAYLGLSTQCRVGLHFEIKTTN
jgi:hypothetical protein